MSAPKRIFFDDRTDQLIRKAYMTGHTKSGHVKKAAAQLGISQASISRRASALGVIRTVHKPNYEWTPEQLEILEQNAHKELEAINRILIKSGAPRRSVDAIRSRIRRLGIQLREAKIDAGVYTLSELARLMGVEKNTVKRHITSGALKAKQRPNVQQLEYVIDAKNVRTWIIQHLPQIDLAACDKYWLVDLLTGAITKE